MKDELVDVLDELGDKTGEVLPKEEVHSRGLWHGGAHLWIYNSTGQVLLQHRSPEKELYPDTWDISCAGHISAGETPLETLVREAREELGLKIDPAEPKFVGITHLEGRLPQGWIHRVFDWTYTLKMDIDIKLLKLQADELVDVKWLDFDEFEADINDAEKIRLYSPRPKYFYELALFEMRKYLKGPAT